MSRFVVDNFEEVAPVTLYMPDLTERQFIDVCAQYGEEYDIEYNADGRIEIMPTPGFRTGGRNSKITGQLATWASEDGRGNAFGPTLFLLPNGARRGSDGAWILRERLRTVENSPLEYPEICPDFLIELRSPADRLLRLHRKMQEWIDNGVQLGWLIDPFERTVAIYRSGQDPQLLTAPEVVEGEAPVAGFRLHTAEIWAKR